MNVLQQCPVCNSTELAPNVLSAKDYLVSGETFQIARCNQCGFLFTNPRPNDEKLGDYYQSTDYISHSETKKGLVNKLYLMARRYTLRRKVRIVADASSGKRLLDIGCGVGAFLHEAKQNGFEVLGIEPEESARAIADEKYGVKVLPVPEFTQIADASRDAITLWHVLEHVEDLDLYWTNFQRILAPGGTLIIAVPNPESPDAVFYQGNWAAYDVPRHLYHFRKDDLRFLAKKYSFQLNQILPMKLDAFYISMLSEKNMHGKSKLIRSFFRGLGFNKKSRKTNNYSSLIYILKKTTVVVNN